MHKNKRTWSARFILTLGIALFCVKIAAQQDAADEGKARDEWRWGVIAYNDGLMGKALSAMERAVTLSPTDNTFREWLGRTYWKSGMEAAALSVWDDLIKNNSASAVLESRAERLRRRLSGDLDSENEEWIVMISIDGENRITSLFEQPTSVRALNNGSGFFLVTSYTNGRVLLMNANGSLVGLYQGGAAGFSRPFDALPISDNQILVSEFNADRISTISMSQFSLGTRIKTWGESGRGEAQFLGPQHMALSPDGQFVYVSDWGNRRVSKWSIEGKHILNIGKNGRFSGFSGPSGIATRGNRVYVADTLKKTISVFDPSGNYIETLVDEGLSAPEGLSIYEGHLLISDGASVHSLNLETGKQELMVSLGEGDHRITSVFPDENGNILAGDFSANQIIFFTPISTLYGGLDVTINRVQVEPSALMRANVTVRDSRGLPVVGLDGTNFQIFEGDGVTSKPEISWNSSDDKSVSIVSIVDPSDVQGLSAGVADLAASLRTQDSLTLVGALSNSIIHKVSPNSTANDFFSLLKKDTTGEGIVQWGSALRLAATSLVPERRRKALVAYVAAQPDPAAFEQYNLIEIARLMSNNGILFYPVYKDKTIQSREFDYLSKETGGQSFLLYSPEGSGRIPKLLRAMNAGRYTLEWKTPRNLGFGRSYMPVTAEVIYIKKSGRGESGTFAPLN